MKAEKKKSEKIIGSYIGMHGKDPGAVRFTGHIDLKKWTDNIVVLGQLGRGMSFSMKVEQLKTTLEERKGGQYDK